MTIIIGFVNSRCAILGIDSLVVQTRQYDDGTSETIRVTRDKLGRISNHFTVAQQGRFTSRHSDMTTQDVCNTILISNPMDFQASCTEIIGGVRQHTDTTQEHMVFIAGKDRGQPKLCVFQSRTNQIDFGTKIISISNQQHCAEL